MHGTLLRVGLPLLFALPLVRAQAPVLVKDINTVAYPNSGSQANQFTSAGGLVYFSAASSVTDTELWRTDGTTNGTVLVKDIVAGPTGSYPSLLTPFGSRLLFVVPHPAGWQLWISDGTATGTTQVPFPGSVSLAPIAVLGNLAFFSAFGVAGEELWMTDGTAAGTALVLDINPGSGSSFPRLLGVHQGWLYFAANSPLYGAELWRTDSTTTSLVADVLPGGLGSNPAHFAVLGNDIYFAANDRPGPFAQSLWRSNGTAAGTVRVVSPVAGTTDGTAAGTRLVQAGLPNAVATPLVLSRRPAPLGVRRRAHWTRAGSAGPGRVEQDGGFGYRLGFASADLDEQRSGAGLGVPPVGRPGRTRHGRLRAGQPGIPEASGDRLRRHFGSSIPRPSGCSRS